MKRFFKTESALDLFKVKTTSSEIFGAIATDGDSFIAENDEISVFSKIEEIGFGVYRRVGKIKNISK